jgi:hypothetical protein
MLNTAGASPNPAESRFPGPLAPGRVDGLGERWTTADSADPLELLRLRGEVVSAPGFELALRDRVKALANFKDPAFVTVRELVQDGDHLTLVSTRGAGQRLSDLSTKIAKGRRVAFVTRLLRDATRALAELEAAGAGITHAALTADRIVFTPEGRVCITEHVFASALQELALWPEELWTEFGLLSRADSDGEAVFDSRTTVMQLAVVALSLLLSRPITLQDFEHRLPALLEEFSGLFPSPSSVVAGPLREWLERALQLGTEPYSSAADAETGLRKLLAELGPAGAVEVDTIQFPSRIETSSEKVVEKLPERSVADPAPSLPTLEAREPAAATAVAVVAAPAVPMVTPAAVVAPDVRPWPRTDVQTVTDDRVQPTERKSASQREQYLMWAAIALIVVAVAEAITITRLVMRPPTVVLNDSSIVVESPQPGDTVLVDGKPVGSTPVKVRVNPKTQAIKLVAAPPPAPVIDPAAVAAKAESDRTAAVLDLAAARQRTGGVQIKTPINLTVLEGDRVLGATADGPIVASSGSHQLEFVNTALGFRVRQTVTIRAGVITPLTITPPMGRISINAQPWAQVLIDDNPVGETPLANIQVPIGDHQITFRHPQMGERRERVTVRADVPARVSTAFQR